MALTDKLTAIADAIRGKTGGTEGMTLDTMVSAIKGIESGGGGSNVQVFTGELTTADIPHGSCLYIEHNLGGKKPFIFYMEPADNVFPGYYQYDIVECIILVPFINETRKLITGEEEHTLDKQKAWFNAILMNNTTIGGQNHPQIIESGYRNINYCVAMHDNGFSIGLYRALRAGVTYKYTLVWGVEL